jgi:nitronate monooxygenase
MSLPSDWRARMRLPIICAPMYHVSTPAMVIAARKAGIIGALPRANAPSFEVFEQWLAAIMDDAQCTGPWRPPVAVNLSTRMPPGEMARHLQACRAHGVELIISATGDPTALIRAARDHGLVVFSDAINLRFAGKAIAAGAHGVIAIGSGGGGHSGSVNHLTLVSAIRRGFDGTVVMAGAVDSGFAVRAAEVLGADLAYVGTRFIASEESGAPEDYKRMLVDAKVEDLMYTNAINGVHANWLKPSMRLQGLDPDRLPAREEGGHGHGHLPGHVNPWRNLWSAGQGVQLIDEVAPLADIVARMERDYAAACRIGAFGTAGLP